MWSDRILQKMKIWLYFFKSIMKNFNKIIKVSEGVYLELVCEVL